MKAIESEIKEYCCKTVQHSSEWGKSYKSKCGRLATHTNGTHFFCRHHAKVGRFVFRVGDVGEILARFDTEQELRDNAHLYPDARGQKITKSSRKDLFINRDINQNQ